MRDYIEVHTTIDSIEGAQKIADALVSQRLAACVQISGPIKSTYWWEGKMEITEEWVCTAKTRHDLYAMVEETIKTAHSYDVPEILAVKIEDGNPAYLAWMAQETS